LHTTHTHTHTHTHTLTLAPVVILIQRLRCSRTSVPVLKVLVFPPVSLRALERIFSTLASENPLIARRVLIGTLVTMPHVLMPASTSLAMSGREGGRGGVM